MLTNSIEIKSIIGYTPRTVRIQFLGSEIDGMLWILSAVALVGAWIALQNRAMLRYRETLIPVFSIMASLGLRFSGREFTGSLLGIISGLVIAFFPLIFANQRETQRPWESALGFIASFLVIILVVEVGSAAGWLYNVMDPHVPFDGESRWIMASLEMNLFGLLYPITLVALVIMMLAWIWIPLLEASAKPLSAKLGRTASLRPSEHLSTAPDLSRKEMRQPMGRNIWQTLLRYKPKFLWPLTITMIAVCAVFIVYYPYIYATRLIGVDTPWYYQNLLTMSSSGGVGFLVSSYGAASRVPYLLILYILMSVTSFPPDLVVKIGPAVPAAFLGVTTLFLVRRITRSDLLAVLSSFLGLFSIATTVGIYAGIFANWLALGWTALFLGLLLQAWREPSARKIVVTTLVSFIVLVTHAWTWAVTLASLGAFVVLSLLYRLSTRRGGSWNSTLRSCAIILGSNLVLLLLIVSRFSAGEFIHLSSEGVASMSLDNLATFPASFAFTVQYYVGGFITNPVIILFAIVGLLVVKKFDEKLRLFLLSMLIVTSIPLVLVGSWWQWRLLYMIPYQILAVLGIVGVSQKLMEAGGRLAWLCQSLLMVTVLLSSFNYALRSLNFVPS